MPRICALLRACCPFAILLAGSLLLGCNGSDDQAAGTGDSGETPAAGTGDTAPAPLAELEGDVQLDVATWDELQQKIGEHKGKVVVLDVWASWCAPCIKELPGLVKLQRQYPNDVVAMSVNLDFEGSEEQSPESYREAVLKILEEHGAKFPNFISATPAEELYEVTEIVSPPTILVYDQSGSLHKQIDVDSVGGGDEEVSYEKHVVPVVKKLVGG